MNKTYSYNRNFFITCLCFTQTDFGS